MKAICLDSEGAWFSECSRSHSPGPSFSEITRLRRAEELDFATLPVVCEGFYDSHLHPTWMARLKNQIDCQNKSAEEIIQEIKGSSQTVIYGHGWREEHLKCSLDQFKELLDRINKDIFLYRICSHMAYASPFGFIKELELKKIPAPKLILSDFESVIDELKAAGLDSWSNLQTSSADYSLLEDQDGLFFADIRELDAFNFFKKKPRYVKVFLDGSIGARTAWMTQSYADQETFGMQLWPDKQLIECLQKSLAAGYLLAFHAIGDAALDQLIKISEYLRNDFRKNISGTFRHRIEHLQVCRDDQIEKLKEQDMWCLGLQPSHRTADLAFSADRLGATRLEKDGYRLKSFLDAGLKISLGSDAPIVSYDPRKTFEAIENDSRAHEKVSRAQIYKIFCVEGRQNAGITAKKLLQNMPLHVSNLTL